MTVQNEAIRLLRWAMIYVPAPEAFAEPFEGTTYAENYAKATALLELASDEKHVIDCDLDEDCTCQ